MIGPVSAFHRVDEEQHVVGPIESLSEALVSIIAVAVHQLHWLSYLPADRTHNALSGQAGQYKKPGNRAGLKTHECVPRREVTLAVRTPA